MIKKHPYITATLVAILLAIVVWLCVPKEYTAITKVSDEYTETDLAIGLNDYNVYRRNISNAVNSGLNNMEIYSKMLKTEDFARCISHMQVGPSGQTYGEYIGNRDTILAVSKHIKCNYSSKKDVLTIGFTDHNELVAAQMLDSVTTLLQSFITLHKQKIADSALKDALRIQNEAAKTYKKAQSDYAKYCDSHTNSETNKERLQKESLENEVDLAFKHYQEVIKKSVRQLALKQRSYMSFSVIKANTVPLSPTPNLMGYIGSFIIIFLLLTKGWFLIKRGRKDCKIDFGDIFSPWFITIMIWTLIITAISLNKNIYPLTQQFWISFILWIPIFLISSLLTYNLLGNGKQDYNLPMKSTGDQVNMPLFNFFFLLLMIMSPLYLYQTYKTVSMFDTSDLMYNVRELALHNEERGVLRYALVIQNAVLIIALWIYPKIKWWKLLFIFIAGILIAVSNMEKMGFFMIFISTIYVLFEKRVIKVRTISMLMLVLLFVFYLFNIARSGENSDYSKNESLLDFFGMYVLSGSVAYGQLQEGLGDIFGQNSLSGFYFYFYKWISGNSLMFTPGDYKEGVLVPMFTNVYTIFSPFFVDFGQKGVAFFALIYGVASGFFYRYAKNGNLFAKCIYTNFVYLLVLQFFEEVLFLAPAVFTQFMILVYLMTENRFSFHGGKRK